MLKINIKAILKRALSIAAAIFSALSIVIILFPTLITVISSHCWVVIISICIISILISCVYILFIRKKRTVWKNGTAKLQISYGDLIESSFDKKIKKERIFVIPVNSCFDTIVDDDIAAVDKPLVSKKSIHGQWINHMISDNGKTLDEIDAMIDSSLKIQNITPIKEIESIEKTRGKRKQYEIGTVAILKGNQNTYFYLLVTTNFDIENKAFCSKEEFIIALNKLMNSIDRNSQRYDLFIPLMGTSFSRPQISHEEAMSIITSVCMINCEKIHGTATLVVYYKDRDTISIGG